MKIPLFCNHLLCNGLRVISRLQLCPQFIFQLNYENDVQIWSLKLLLQKYLIRKFSNCSKISFKKSLLIIKSFITFFYKYFFNKLFYFPSYILIFFSTTNQTYTMIIFNHF